MKVSVNNMQTVLTDVKQQGDTIIKISSNVQDANLAVKRTDNMITKMNNRSFILNAFFMCSLLFYLLR